MIITKQDVYLELKDVSDEGTFKGYGAVFGNKDLGGDVITPGAFTKTLSERKTMPLLWHHHTHEVIGIFSGSEDPKGLAVAGSLNLEVQRAREVHSLMKQGAVTGMSIGYTSQRKDWVGDTRMLRELKLYEVSLLPFPMNPQAQVAAVKSADDFALLMREILAYKGELLTADQLDLIEHAEQKLSALRAAKAPGAAKQQDNAPEILHAMLTERISKIKENL